MILTHDEKEFLPSMIYALEKSDLWTAHMSEKEEEMCKKILEKLYEEINPEFETVAKPVMKYLAEKTHPHTTCIITSTNAEVLEGIKTVGDTDEFLID